MDGVAVAGVSIISLLVIQIITFAYGYGKLSQCVKDVVSRVKRIEDILNGRK